MANYHIGDRVRCSGNLAMADDTAIDPAAVFGWFIAPSGTKTTYIFGTDIQLVRDSTGMYHMDIDLDTAGRWLYGFYSTGTGKAASKDELLVVNNSRRS